MISPRPPLHYLPQTLTDGIVLLDVHRLEDAEAHLLGEDEEMRRRFNSLRPATLEETRQAVERWIAGRADGGPMFAYAMRKVSGKLVGGCELRMRSASSANLSYWVLPSFRGRGLALRAVNLVSAAAEAIPGLRRLEVRIAPDNKSSRRIAVKAGFIEAGCVKEKVRTGSFSTMLLYAKEIGTN